MRACECVTQTSHTNTLLLLSLRPIAGRNGDISTTTHSSCVYQIIQTQRSARAHTHHPTAEKSEITSFKATLLKQQLNTKYALTIISRNCVASNQNGKQQQQLSAGQLLANAAPDGYRPPDPLPDVARTAGLPAKRSAHRAHIRKYVRCVHSCDPPTNLATGGA